jgi:hypothetical protein
VLVNSNTLALFLDWGSDTGDATGIMEAGAAQDYVAAVNAGGGGGAMDWLALSLLASLRFLRSRRTNGPFVREPSRESLSSRRTLAVGSARSLRSV